MKGARLFREQGYERTKVAEIARSAECASALAYKYFPTKHSLLAAHFAELEEMHALAARSALRTTPDLGRRIALVLKAQLAVLQGDRLLIGPFLRGPDGESAPPLLWGTEVTSGIWQAVLRGTNPPLPDEAAALAVPALRLAQRALLGRFALDVSPGHRSSHGIAEQIGGAAAIALRTLGHPQAALARSELLSLIVDAAPGPAPPPSPPAA